MSHALDVPCKLRWDVHELGQWNDATVLYPCDRVSTGTDSRAVTRMVPDDLGGGDKGVPAQENKRPRSLSLLHVRSLWRGAQVQCE
jgi:hypothetical protein